MDPSVAALLSILAVAAITDLRTRRIPNLLVAFGLCFGFGLAWSSMGQAGLMFALKGAATGFVLFFPLFLLRAFGAGDVKLLMVVGAFVGPQDVFTISLLALVAGRRSSSWPRQSACPQASSPN